ncbi:major capsid protein, partial [Enterobacter hormaechei]|uniref:major capsid protein n=1 Tax=Enterobacter hormaechei TaxID=158836 RepID=UPI001FEFD0D8
MFVFSKSIGEKTGNLAVNQAQWRALEIERNASAQAAADFLARTQFRGDAENAPYLDAVNAVDDIRRLYRAFDTTVLQQFEPNTEFTLLNDLMPLSRSVRIEQSRYCQQRVKSDPLTATTNGLILIHLVYSGLASAITPAFRFCFSR